MVTAASWLIKHTKNNTKIQNAPNPAAKGSHKSLSSRVQLQKFSRKKKRNGRNPPSTNNYSGNESNNVTHSRTNHFQQIEEEIRSILTSITILFYFILTLGLQCGVSHGMENRMTTHSLHLFEDTIFHHHCRISIGQCHGCRGGTNGLFAAFRIIHQQVTFHF